MSFYMTLPSDSSMKYFPENKISSFVTRLPAPITLNGEWEVGLSEIIYPHTWLNITEETNLFEYVIGKGKHTKTKIPQGFYETTEELIKTMTRQIKENKPPLIQLNYNKNSKRVKIILKGESKLILHRGIAENLGFPPGNVCFETENAWENVNENEVERIVESPFVADPNALFSLLFVYSNVVSPQIVGDVQAPLLRVVNVRGKPGEIISSQYDRPHYLPVSQKYFQTIEIEIKSVTGKPVPFERGKVIIVLHFRMRQLL